MPVLTPTPSPANRSGATAGVAAKGQKTKAAIVDAALHMAGQVGLEGLSIGTLADAMQMSKSGVFAHFGSREELQISVVREYHTRFEHEVFFPALEEARGLPRLHCLFDNWMRRTSTEIDTGCIYISGAVEFDDRPGPVRDELVRSVSIWMEAIRRAVAQAQEEGHLSRTVDAHQIGFEIHALILALQYEARFLRMPGSIERARRAFDRMMSAYGAAPSAPESAARKSTRSSRRA